MELIRYSVFNPDDKKIGFMAIADHYIDRRTHCAFVTYVNNPHNLETSIAKNYANTPGAIYDHMLDIRTRLEEKTGVAYEVRTRTLDEIEEVTEEID